MIILRNIQTSNVESDSTFEIISNNTPIAKAIVLEDEGIIDISSIYTEDIPRAIETIIEYAKQSNKRVIEFPQIYLYDDGTYKGDVMYYDLLHDTKPNTIDNDQDTDINNNEIYFASKFKKQNHMENSNQDQWGINGKIWKYMKEKYANVMTLMMNDKVNHEYPSELKWKQYVPVLCLPRAMDLPKNKLYDIRIELYENEDWFKINTRIPFYAIDAKGVVLQGCEKHHTSQKNVVKTNVRKIVFDKSLCIHISSTQHSNHDYKHRHYMHNDDIYIALYVNGKQLVRTYDEARCFRLNKLRTYSDANYYNICEYYPKSIKQCIYVINDLTFPESIFYTEHAYPLVAEYVQDIPKPKLKRDFFVEHILQPSLTTMILHDSSSKATTSSDDVSYTSYETNIHDDTITSSRGYIYLIRKREHVRMREKVYKHGKTKIDNPTLFIPRFNAYDKGSELCYIRMVDSDKVDMIETKITHTFRRLFQKHSDGREYFVGNQTDMIHEIEKIIQQFH